MLTLTDEELTETEILAELQEEEAFNLFIYFFGSSSIDKDI